MDHTRSAKMRQHLDSTFTDTGGLNCPWDQTVRAVRSCNYSWFQSLSSRLPREGGREGGRVGRE